MNGPVVLQEPVADLDRKLPWIRRFIREGCLDPEIQRVACVAIVERGIYRVSANDPWTEAVALFEWVRRHVRFVPDPQAGEVARMGDGVTVRGPADLVQNPAVTLMRRAGDCVALTVLLGAMACARDFPVGLRLQDTRGQGIDHVLLLVGFPRGQPDSWFALDATLAEPGVERQVPSRSEPV